ncbi:MAG: NAD(P)H-dependent oxidoreductase [Blautia sp.]|nr:NAD(P)H-dependent oxidoreductase [Blautia sp.]
MRVLVVNGSPKGKNSVTYQTIRFLQKKFPKDTFETIHAGAQIGRLEQDMTPVCDAVKEADMILFAYPVYTFIAPAQLQRFIELLKEQGLDLSGKYATQITTSKHFYDVTAHRYVEDNCKDMKMRILKGFSADMSELLTKVGQLQVITYWNYTKHIIEQEAKSDIGKDKKTNSKEKSKKYRVVIVTDCKKENERLRQMIIDFRKGLPFVSHVVNLQDFEFQGGCLGCLHCAADGVCIYQDGFEELLRNKIQRADSIVYAFSIKDHSMGPLFKVYDDRQFCNGHRSVTMGKPTAYLIDGEFSQEENLRVILEGRSQVGGNFLASIATNEGVGADSPRVCADKLAYALIHRIKVNDNFYGVGGRKIFRDLVFEMQGMMYADHKFYQRNRLYDFPQKKIGTILLMKLVGFLLRRPETKAQVQAKMTEGMLMPYEKIIS